MFWAVFVKAFVNQANEKLFFKNKFPKKFPEKKIPKFFITVFLISLSDFKKPQFTPDQGFTDGVTDDYRPDLDPVWQTNTHWAKVLVSTDKIHNLCTFETLVIFLCRK